MNPSQIRRRSQYGGDGQSPEIPNVRYVTVRTNGPQYIQIAQMAVYAIDNPTINLAQGKPTNSLNALGSAVASTAVDGTLSPRAYPNIYHSMGQNGDFWSVDLGAAYSVNKVVYYNRQDCCNERALNYVLELKDGNGKVVWSGPLTADMTQTITFTPTQVPITDPYRFLPIEKKCEGYVNKVKSGPDYEQTFYKKQIADVCMPYYTDELNKCHKHEGHTLANIENKIAKCATSLHTCQTAFNINTQNTITSAIYGNKDSKQTMDVLALLNKQRSEGTAEIVVSNVTFGSDPAPGVHKFLYLTLHTSYNADQRYTIPENQSINLDAPDATGPQAGGPSGAPGASAFGSGTGVGTLTFSTLGQGQSGGSRAPQRGGWLAFNEGPSFLTNMVAKIEHTVAPSTIPADKSPHCKVWAAKRPSACKTDANFMNTNCATSCAAAPTGAPLPADLQRAENMKYGIEHHREYPAFLKRYKPKSECPDKRYVLKADVAPVFDQTLRLVKKLNDLKANFSTDIRNHPDYKILMDKYALRDSQNNYTACSKC